MRSLTELHEAMLEKDAEFSAEERAFIKAAADENAAGRITCRGFMDELEKLAEGLAGGPMKVTHPPMEKREPLIGSAPSPKITRTMRPGAIALPGRSASTPLPSAPLVGEEPKVFRGPKPGVGVLSARTARAPGETP